MLLNLLAASSLEVFVCRLCLLLCVRIGGGWGGAWGSRGRSGGGRHLAALRPTQATGGAPWATSWWWWWAEVHPAVDKMMRELVGVWHKGTSVRVQVCAGDGESLSCAIFSKRTGGRTGFGKRDARDLSLSREINTYFLIGRKKGRRRREGLRVSPLAVGADTTSPRKTENETPCSQGMDRWKPTIAQSYGVRHSSTPDLVAPRWW